MTLVCKLGCGHPADRGSRYCSWCSSVLGGKFVAERKPISALAALARVHESVKAGQ